MCLKYDNTHADSALRQKCFARHDTPEADRSGALTAKTLAIANKKGGTGKSTMTVNLAAELGARGYRVLIVDTDPQGHAGLGFGVSARDEARSVHRVFHALHPDLAGGVRATSEPGVDVLPADRGFDGQVQIGDPRCLARALDRIKPRYDVVLIDTPPAAANVTVCVLMAADGVIVPTILDYLALDGVRQFARAYHQVVLQLKATLLGLAIAPMMIDLRSNMQKQVLADLQLGFGGGQMMRGVRIDVSAAEAFALRHPLRRYRINSRAAEDFRAVADDVIRRFNLPVPAQASGAEPSTASDPAAEFRGERHARL
jgi:chromosome partitioning protein